MSQEVSLITRIIRLFKQSTIPMILITLGMIGQSFHTYFVVYKINAFKPPLDVISSIILAVFFSGGLLYFSVKLGLEKSKPRGVKDNDLVDKYNNATGWFQAFETFTNLFYWITKIIYKDNHFVFDDIYWLIVALPLAIMLPLILRYYAGEITDKWQEENTTNLKDKTLVVDITTETNKIIYSNARIKINSIEEPSSTSAKGK